MGIVNGIRVVEKLISGDMDTAQLDSWLSTGINKASFIQAINSTNQARALAESSAAMGVISVSSVAMPLLVVSKVAMAALCGSPVSKMAMYNSDTALALIAASGAAVSIMRLAAGYEVLSTTSSQANFARPLLSSKTGTALALPSTACCIALGISNTPITATPYTDTVATTRVGSTRPNALARSSAVLHATGTLALNTIVTPISYPFTIISTETTNVASYVGILRCDE